MGYNWNFDDTVFENLSIDIAITSLKLSTHIESFKKGKDLGIDGRYLDNDNELCIIQCKHFLKSPFSTLKSQLQNEYQKLQEKEFFAKITRYILFTSVELTPQNKNAIITIFQGKIQNSQDICGKNDMETLIRNCQIVENRYYQLWTGTDILKNLNNKINTNTQITLQNINLSTYVETQSCIDAKNKLNSRRCVIITGTPGIGKTTLAQYLLLDYIKQNYIPVVIENIDDAKTMFDNTGNTKQIFYFDDFLGRQILDAQKNDDSKIIKFIRNINKDENRAFILTTRTYILSDAKNRNAETYRETNSHTFEYEVKMTELSKSDKAQILYKHLWHSNIDLDFLKYIVNTKYYNKIIEHKNFTPRIISYIADHDKHSAKHLEEYISYIHKTLTNPSAIWEEVFRDKQAEYSNNIAYFVYLHEGISYTELYEAFKRLHANISVMHIKQTFDDALKVAIKNTVSHFSNNTFRLHDPSVGDYILCKLRDDNDKKVEYLKHLQSPISLIRQDKHTLNKLIPTLHNANNTDYNDTLVEKLLENINDEDELQALQNKLSTYEYNAEKIKNIIIKIITKEVEYKLEYLDYDDVMIQYEDGEYAITPQDVQALLYQEAREINEDRWYGLSDDDLDTICNTIDRYDIQDTINDIIHNHNDTLQMADNDNAPAPTINIVDDIDALFQQLTLKN